MDNSSQKLKLDILISTYAGGILDIPRMLLPQRDDVRYTVSMQFSTPSWKELVPKELYRRSDVTLDFLPGIGLSRNRNNSIARSGGDILLIADDDNVYTDEYIDTILETWRENPDADIITFMAEDYEGNPLHEYPAQFVCSVEMTMRRDSIIWNNLKFDERFGLGSPKLCAGEEEVFLANARRLGLKILFIPKVIVRTRELNTTRDFVGDSKLQMTKGATFKYIYGTANAVWRSFKEAGWYMFNRKANPFPILTNMLKGVWMYR